MPISEKLKQILSDLAVGGPIFGGMKVAASNPEAVSQGVEELYGAAKSAAPFLEVGGIAGPLEKGIQVAKQAPIWYSGLEKVIRERMPPMATVEQAKALVGGGKKAENVGVVDWLKGMVPGSKVRKEEVLGKVREGRQEFEDVVLETAADGTVTGEQRARMVGPEYSQYVEPGGANYKELFVTAPKAAKVNSEEMRTINKLGQMFGDDRSLWPAEYRRYANEAETTKVWRDGHSNYSDIENPIVRLRFNDRTTPDGKKILFLEELQPPSGSQWWEVNGKKFEGEEASKKAKEYATSIGATAEKRFGGEFAKMPPMYRDSWREIGMKRALKYAADNGYSGVAWTPGEVQVKRYPGVGEHVDELQVFRGVGGEGTSDIVAIRNGQQVKTPITVKDSELAGKVGKDLASKILSGSKVHQSYKGMDLFIGGEGLRKVYDEDLPNVANQFGKKYGGKVETTKIKVADDIYADFAAFRRRYLADHPDATPQEVTVKYGDETQAGRANIMKEVPYIPITPPMAKSLTTEGVPYFAPVLPPPMATTDSDKKKEKSNGR